MTKDDKTIYLTNIPLILAVFAIPVLALRVSESFMTTLATYGIIAVIIVPSILAGLYFNTDYLRRIQHPDLHRNYDPDKKMIATMGLITDVILFSLLFFVLTTSPSFYAL
jgi:hypothetical protein